MKDIDFAGYDPDTYTKGTYILYVQEVVDGDQKVLASKIAETVEGEVTAVKGDKVYVDGTSYTDVSGDDPSIGDKGTFYLNAAGQIMETDTESKSSNYAYIYSVDKKNGTNSDGIKTNTYTAYLVTADGTKASYVIDPDDIDEDGKFDGVTAEDFKGVIAYAINSDDELQRKTAKDTIGDGVANAAKSDKNAALVGTKNGTASTVYVFVEKKSNKVNVTTTTGYRNVSIAQGTTVYTVSNDKDNALYVFVDAKNGSTSSNERYAVILDATPIKTKDGDDTIYTYSVSIDGVDSELSAKDEVFDGAEKGDVVEYTMDGDYVNGDDVVIIATDDFETVTAANDDYFIVDGEQYNLGTETIYTITMEYKTDGTTLDTVSVSEGGAVEKDDKVFFTLDKDELELVFVIDEIK